MDQISAGIIGIIVVLISLTFHEAAHALVAYRLGDPTARDQGRLSLNPIVHIDVLGTLILPLVLAISGAGIFGWAKPVPVNPNNLKNPHKDNGLIALAGPAANLLLAIVSALLIRVLMMTAHQGAGSSYILVILVMGIQINVLLMMFNLLPIPPLDGGSVLSMFLSPTAMFKFHQFQRYGFIILIILIFSGILSTIYFRPIGGLFNSILYSIAGIH